MSRYSVRFVRPFSQFVLAVCLSCCSFVSKPARSNETSSDSNRQETTVEPVWHISYEAARYEAIANRTCLWIVFHDADAESIKAWKAQLNDDLALKSFLSTQTCALLAVDSPNLKLEDSELPSPQPLLTHPAFAELQRRPGLAVVDFRDHASQSFRQVISVVPNDWRGELREERQDPLPSLDDLREVTRLPWESLTVRTLLLAVRSHPDHPRSADGEMHPVLQEEARKHAGLQASLGVQGHHDWGRRFQFINEQLPTNVVAQEICAESWSGQGLLAAARECVHSWRQSPGHWHAVSSRHPYYGFDMQRGTNGTWYATGIFGKAR